MANFSKECIETFLNKQLQLFDEKVAETPQEAEEFLEDNLAVVLDSIEDVRDYLDESGMDAAQLSKDEILQASEVFALPGGKYLSGLAAGAATIGCCCNMVGFAVASYRENKVAGLLAQGIGTSMLQVPNIVRKPIIWIPAIVSSAVLGPVSTMLVKMTSNATGSGMGTAGFVGQIMTYQTMAPEIGGTMTMIIIVVFQIVLPAVITLAVSEFMRKKGWIKDGDMKLEL